MRRDRSPVCRRGGGLALSLSVYGLPFPEGSSSTTNGAWARGGVVVESVDGLVALTDASPGFAPSGTSSPEASKVRSSSLATVARVHVLVPCRNSTRMPSVGRRRASRTAGSPHRRRRSRRRSPRREVGTARLGRLASGSLRGRWRLRRTRRRRCCRARQLPPVQLRAVSALAPGLTSFFSCMTSSACRGDAYSTNAAACGFPLRPVTRRCEGLGAIL